MMNLTLKILYNRNYFNYAYSDLNFKKYQKYAYTFLYLCFILRFKIKYIYTYIYIYICNMEIIFNIDLLLGKKF